jgi:hypothetical protein
MSNNPSSFDRYDSNHRAGVTIRTAGREDEPALGRLAQLDSTPLPPAPLLIAEIEGRLVAAISLATGESFADPFSRTVELRALLELRAAQLRRRETRRGLPHPLPRPASRAALAAGPAGIGRWLIAVRTRLQ